MQFSEAALQRSSYKKVFWKYVANLQGAKLQRDFIEMVLWNGCSPVNLLNIFRTPFPKNTLGGLLLNFEVLAC